MKDLEIMYVKEETNRNKTNRANLILEYELLEIKIDISQRYGYLNNVRQIFSTSSEENFKKYLNGLLKRDGFKIIQTYITDDCELIVEVYKAE